VMGLACAWRLARARVEVLLFEARRCGEGATLAALGALWPTSAVSRGAVQEMHRKSLWGYEGFVREVEAAAGMAIGFRRGGRLERLAGEREVARAREEAEAACEHWPAFGGERPVMDVVEDAGLWSLRCRATAQVKVWELVPALVKACGRVGVIVQEETPVAGVEMAEGRVRGVRTEAGDFAVDGVVVTAGAWTTRLVPGVEVRPVKGQGVSVERPAGLELETIVKWGSIYVIPWEEEVLIGATTEAEAGFDEVPTEAARAALLAGAAEMVPGLRGAKVLRHWAGLRPQRVVKGHAPFMGRCGAENLWVCAGHYKTGIGMAPEASRVMVEMILGKT
jgi:glycine oxidase